MRNPNIGDTVMTSGGEAVIVAILPNLISVRLPEHRMTVDYFSGELEWNEQPGCWYVVNLDSASSKSPLTP